MNIKKYICILIHKMSVTTSTNEFMYGEGNNKLNYKSSEVIK